MGQETTTRFLPARGPDQPAGVEDEVGFEDVRIDWPG
jgi:hypothetical protein